VSCWLLALSAQFIRDTEQSGKKNGDCARLLLPKRNGRYTYHLEMFTLLERFLMCGRELIKCVSLICSQFSVIH